MRRPLALVTAIMLGAIILSGCGDDDSTDAASSSGSDETTESVDSTEPTESAEPVEVVAHDIGFDADHYEASAADVEVLYTNDGNIGHTLRIDGVDDFKLEVAANGDEDEGTVELEPGTYTLYCDVPGHRAAGMEATLEIS